MSTDKRHPCRICKGYIACKSLGHTSPNKSIGDFSGNGVLVSVSLVLMLLLHQVKKKEQAQGRGKAGLMCSACSYIPFHYRFRPGFPFGSTYKDVWSSVQNCGV
uniref:Uncharacterized protein n=1 Tax=Zea mays TaxID=4577 RepID=C0PCN8_MAIZE|nr:unknown [Zea mays]